MLRMTSDVIKFTPSGDGQVTTSHLVHVPSILLLLCKRITVSFYSSRKEKPPAKVSLLFPDFRNSVFHPSKLILFIS